jgi:hypothetical protein
MKTFSAMLALYLITGCAPSSEFTEVTGDVLWNGAPMPTGMIVLQPFDPKTPPSGGPIRDGKFQLKTKPGRMRVQIEAVRATNHVDPDTGTKLGEMYIPSRYNTQTELEAEVTAGGNNHVTFELKD